MATVLASRKPTSKQTKRTDSFNSFNGFTHTLYIQMQCCEGKTLQDYISTDNLVNGFDDKLKVFYEIVKGLEHVHSKKLMHRDLKPSNIFFMDGIPKIGDFGLAKVLDTATGNDTTNNSNDNDSNDNFGIIGVTV